MSPSDSKKSSSSAAPKKSDATPRESKRATQVRRKTSRMSRTILVSEARKTADVSREMLTSRVLFARRQGLVVLAFRTIGGAVATLAVCSAFFFLILLPLIEYSSGWILILSVPSSFVLVLVARFASVQSMPDAANNLAFLNSHAFVWADPFRDERPRFLPIWMDAVLWAPNQVTAGLEPFMMLHAANQADAEAAGDVARAIVEKGEVKLDKGLPPDSAEARGLKMLLLLRLARLIVEDGKLRGRLSGLGQAALFEGRVG